MRKDVLKKTNKILFITCCMVALIFLCALGISLIHKDLEASHESGFYNEDIDVKLNGGFLGSKIYYTLDGSEPTLDSKVYNAPIHISDATDNPNTISNRKDLSTSFYFDEQKEKHTYDVPDFNVDKCTILRASVIDAFGDKKDDLYKVYFVDFAKKDGYDNAMVVSICADEADLFDYEKGIYVTGKTFDEYLNGNIESEHNEWWWLPANYKNKGSDWERKSRVTIFDNDKQCIVDKIMGMRIQGGGSRGYLPKSLNLYNRIDYDGKDKIGVDLFGNGRDVDAITLFAGGDDRICKVNDYMISQFCSLQDFATMNYKKAVMFLNGEYWGVYYISEKYDEQYFADYYGVDEDNIIMVKNGEVEIGKQSDINIYNTDRDFLRNTDLSAQNHVQELYDRVDMDSFFDYYATEYYIARNNDWPGSNYALWRTREKRDDEYSDCKWRWILFDVNSGALEDAEFDSMGYLCEVDPVFSNLMSNDVIKGEFLNRVKGVSEIFSPDKTNAFFDEYKINMASMLKNEHMRFSCNNKEKENRFLEILDARRKFFEKRYEIISH